MLYYFYQTLSPFNKLNTMSEAEHDIWKSLKSFFYKFHELVFDRGDNSLECINRATHKYRLWQLIAVRCHIILFILGIHQESETKKQS
jgi:hypothetical protein